MSNGDVLVEIAREEIGTEEDKKHQNAGSSIKKYQASTSLGGQGWPWCAAFVDWCIQKYVTENQNTKITHIPRTALAFGLIAWGKDNHYTVFNPPIKDTDTQPKAGDIVVYEFSHTGIVSRTGDTKHDFYAIEGNTNPGGGSDGYEVAERGRNYSSVRKFIRFL
jgi:CHAP domain